MYKSIEQIKKLREEKHAILKNVYQSNNPDDVYKNQSALGAMSISIFTNVANAIMPTLQEDGVSNIVWSNVSLRLNKLSFISVPTAAEIRENISRVSPILRLLESTVLSRSLERKPMSRKSRHLFSWLCWQHRVLRCLCL